MKYPTAFSLLFLAGLLVACCGRPPRGDDPELPAAPFQRPVEPQPRLEPRDYRKMADCPLSFAIRIPSHES